MIWIFIKEFSEFELKIQLRGGLYAFELTLRQYSDESILRLRSRGISFSSTCKPVTGDVRKASRHVRRAWFHAEARLAGRAITAPYSSFDRISERYKCNNVFSAEPHLVLATTRTRLRAFKHLVLRYCKWGMNESFLSKTKPANFFVQPQELGFRCAATVDQGASYEGGRSVHRLS